MQFLGEAVLTALLALLVALALVEILRPAFGRLLQHPIAIPYDGVVAAAACCHRRRGGFVERRLSRAGPVGLSTFRDTAQRQFGHAASGRLQSVLVVLQFAVSIGLGIAVMVVFSQISFARNIDLGFRKDNLLVSTATGC